MAFSHTNSVRYSYKAGGVTTSKTIEVTETESGEVNIEEVITFTSASASSGTVDFDIEGFEFQTASTAVSTYFLLDGVNGTLKAWDGSTATLMADLDDGVPYVWSKNGGTSFPSGTSNKMVDGTTKLIVRPDAYDETNNPKHVDGDTATITVRVLYNATP
tara:strand:+ start:374 stop:853 length:480 start_codon:yes stop_codon:yes gene_type:complete